MKHWEQVVAEADDATRLPRRWPWIACVVIAAVCVASDYFTAWWWSY